MFGWERPTLPVNYQLLKLVFIFLLAYSERILIYWSRNYTELPLLIMLQESRFLCWFTRFSVWLHSFRCLSLHLCLSMMFYSGLVSLSPTWLTPRLVCSAWDILTWCPTHFLKLRPGGGTTVRFWVYTLGAPWEHQRQVYAQPWSGLPES